MFQQLQVLQKAFWTYSANGQAKSGPGDFLGGFSMSIKSSSITCGVGEQMSCGDKGRSAELLEGMLSFAAL